MLLFAKKRRRASLAMETRRQIRQSCSFQAVVPASAVTSRLEPISRSTII